MVSLLKQMISPINIIILIIALLITGWIWLVLDKKKSRQLRNYLPNIWTSLGILGTFISIVWALSDKNVNWSNINQLVTNIAPAFWTSIIGISGAICTSVYAKKKYAEEDFSLSEAFLKDYKMTPEQLVGAINQKMAVLLKVTQRQHNALMEEMKTQNSLAERMITEFTTNLRNFYDNLYEEERQHAQEMVDQYLSAINLLIMSTHGTIKEKFETLFTEHSESLGKLMESEENKFTMLAGSIETTLNENSQALITSISEIGAKEIDLFDTITKFQEEQLQTVVKDNKAGLDEIIKDNQSSLTNLKQDASQNLTRITNEFTSIVESLKASFENLADGLPDSLTQIKTDLIETIQTLADEKFKDLTESHSEFVGGLLKKVEEFETQISNQNKDNQKDWSKAVNAILIRMLNQVDADVKGHMTLMQETSQGINGELASIIEALKKATTSYTSINEQITTLVSALQKETNATEVYANSVSSTNTQLSAIQKLLKDIVNKNLQLRQELAQWKRTHKLVKVDVEKGTKECPNCKTENPIDASYCRKCATSFWECKPIEENRDD